MNLTICGKAERVDNIRTVVDLLRHLRISDEEKGYAVAVNEEIIFRSHWSSAVLSEGDRVEIVRATQGG